MDLPAELVGESPPIEAVRDQIRRLLVRRETGRRLPAALIILFQAAHRGTLFLAILPPHGRPRPRHRPSLS